ncbi:hypothetical protein PRZ48_002756 [Zasmidium cellare]|uniref:F-box domain-containing protein n=1 Tax=Zasmidium cellare TaxID=395010 RepID=A0ABR0ETR0_ZASCE|nr:hypothetical protein PRZ48_002756 [Zasmidium cellare]
MSTYRERRMQHSKDVLKGLFKNLNPSELAEFRQHAQTYDPEEGNGNASFLGLPAEIRNIIYHYVAADAHASAVAPTSKELFNAAKFVAIRDKDGRKLRPGLFGTCREVFREFHGIFYSPMYIKAKVHMKHEEWRKVTDSALLDAVVNEKHLSAFTSTLKNPSQFEAIMANIPKYDGSVQGGYESVLADGSIAVTPFFMALVPPWIERFGTTVYNWSMAHSCLKLASAMYVPSKENRCAVCLVSMGPERAASEETRYLDPA